LYRQTNLKACIAGFGHYANVAVMITYDAGDGIESQARAFANLFCGKERLEDARLNFGGNARAVVADFD